jgi:hypothetical protein
LTTVIAHNVYNRAFGVVIIAAVVAFFSPSRTIAADATSCPSEPQQAISAARAALGADNAEGKDHALLCLIEAVAALDTKIEGIRTGAIPLKGFVDARGGLLIRSYGKADK